MIALLFCDLHVFILYLSQNNLKSCYYENKRPYFYSDCHCGVPSLRCSFLSLYLILFMIGIFLSMQNMVWL